MKISYVYVCFCGGKLEQEEESVMKPEVGDARGAVSVDSGKLFYFTMSYVYLVHINVRMRCFDFRVWQLVFILHSISSLLETKGSDGNQYYEMGRD